MPLAIDCPAPSVLVVTRGFSAPPERVYDAHVDPALIARWMVGYGGWSMPVCVNDARPGGAKGALRKFFERGTPTRRGPYHPDQGTQSGGRCVNN